MGICGRVYDERRKVKPVDDCGESSDQMLYSLASSVKAECMRQGEIIFFELQSKFGGDIFAAMDKLEKLYSNAA